MLAAPLAAGVGLALEVIILALAVLLQRSTVRAVVDGAGDLYWGRGGARRFGDEFGCGSGHGEDGCGGAEEGDGER